MGIFYKFARIGQSCSFSHSESMLTRGNDVDRREIVALRSIGLCGHGGSDLDFVTNSFDKKDV